MVKKYLNDIVFWHSTQIVMKANLETKFLDVFGGHPCNLQPHTLRFFPGGVTAVWGCWPGQREKFSIYVMNPSHKDTCWLGVIRGSCLLVLYQQHCKAALRREGGTGPSAKYFTDMKAIHSHTSTQNPQRPHQCNSYHKMRDRCSPPLIWDYEVPTFFQMHLLLTL